jgi:hypothetical protein
MGSAVETALEHDDVGATRRLLGELDGGLGDLGAGRGLLVQLATIRLKPGQLTQRGLACRLDLRVAPAQRQERHALADRLILSWCVFVGVLRAAKGALLCLPYMQHERKTQQGAQQQG